MNKNKYKHPGKKKTYILKEKETYYNIKKKHVSPFLKFTGRKNIPFLSV